MDIVSPDLRQSLFCSTETDKTLANSKSKFCPTLVEPRCQDVNSAAKHIQRNNIKGATDYDCSIDLPPPVPGRRAAEQRDWLPGLQGGAQDCGGGDRAAAAMLDILATALDRGLERPDSRACLGRHLCRSMYLDPSILGIR